MNAELKVNSIDFLEVPADQPYNIKADSLPQKSRIMLRCEGVSGGCGTRIECPHQHGYVPTHNSRGDVQQCKTCEAIRFPDLATSNNSVSNNTTHRHVSEVTPSVTLLSHTLKQLSDLELSAEPVKAFMNSMNMLYSYNAIELQAALGKLPMDTLKDMYSALWEKMGVTFNMKDSRPKSRQAKHTIIPDVYNFGLSLVNGLMSKEVDRIYINRESASAPTDNETAPATPELESILKLVMNLQIKVSSLEKGLAEVKPDNLVLQERLSTSSSCCINHTAGTPSPAVDSVCTSEGTNTREADTAVMRDSVPDNGGVTPASIITPSQEPSASGSSTDESSDNEESSTEWPTGITIRPFLVKRGQLSNNGSRQEHRDSTRLRAAKNSYHDYNRRSTYHHANEPHHGQRSRHNQQNSRQDRQQYYQNDSYGNSYYY